MLAGLQVRPQVGAHLTQRLARRPPHLRMLVCQTLRTCREAVASQACSSVWCASFTAVHTGGQGDIAPMA